MFGLKFLKADGLEVADITSVVMVQLVFRFVTGNFDLRSINNDDIVASINMRRISDFMLAAQMMSGRCGNIAKRFAFCVNNEPFSFYFGRLCADGGKLSLARHCRGHCYWTQVA